MTNALRSGTKEDKRERRSAVRSDRLTTDVASGFMVTVTMRRKGNSLGSYHASQRCWFESSS